METSEARQLFNFYPINGSAGDTPGRCDTGFRREIPVRPGLWVSLINFSADRPIRMAYEKTMPVIDMGFVIAGSIQKRLDGDVGKHEMQARAGLSGFQFNRLTTGDFVIPPHEAQKLLHIHMTPEFFREIMDREYQVLPPGLQAVLNNEADAEFSFSGPMAPEVQAVVYQVLNSSSNALPWHLYLEGKILELLSLQLAVMSMAHRKSSTILLNTVEKEQIARARELLVKDLQEPPTLRSLAGATGLSMDKLQAGFKEAYGKSVFDYFREYRMQTARTLLGKTETNVSETAWEVGYVNVSHFSSAFKKRFGILPKQYLRSSLENHRNNGESHQAPG